LSRCKNQRTELAKRTSVTGHNFQTLPNPYD